MNTSVVRSIKKTPFEVVFGQKANSFESAGIDASSVNIEDICDVVGDEEVPSDGDSNFMPTMVNFNVHPADNGEARESNEMDIDDINHSDLSDNSAQKDQSFESFPVTCKIRQDIRTTVKKSLDENAEMIIKKTLKSKRIQVADFSVGQNVSVFIPSRDRRSSDLKRLPCVIVHKSSGNLPTYISCCVSMGLSLEDTLHQNYWPIRVKFAVVTQIVKSV